jgi:hypothetical protein
MHPETCTYFTGLAEKMCQQGIAYRTLGAGGIPCVPVPGRDEAARQAICALLTFPTPEECQRDREEEARAIKDWIIEAQARSVRGACVQCGTTLTATRQIGRCIYAEPCGCRLGQGTLRDATGTQVARLPVTGGTDA